MRWQQLFQLLPFTCDLTSHPCGVIPQQNAASGGTTWNPLYIQIKVYPTRDKRVFSCQWNRLLGYTQAYKTDPDSESMIHIHKYQETLAVDNRMNPSLDTGWILSSTTLHWHLRMFAVNSTSVWIAIIVVESLVPAIYVSFYFLHQTLTDCVTADPVSSDVRAAIHSRHTDQTCSLVTMASCGLSGVQRTIRHL